MNGRGDQRESVSHKMKAGSDHSLIFCSGPGFWKAEHLGLQGQSGLPKIVGNQWIG